MTRNNFIRIKTEIVRIERALELINDERGTVTAVTPTDSDHIIIFYTTEVS